MKLNAKVTSLTEREGKFLVRTAGEGFVADQFVVATGRFQVPFVPLGPTLLNLWVLL